MSFMSIDSIDILQLLFTALYIFSQCSNCWLSNW